MTWMMTLTATEVRNMTARAAKRALSVSSFLPGWCSWAAAAASARASAGQSGDHQDLGSELAQAWVPGLDLGSGPDRLVV